MRAVIYTRVSSDPNNLGRSVEEQEADCRAVCEREGWQVVRVFSDNDRSASRYAKKERPEYQALRAFLEAGKADVLVMWEGSRAQRDLEAYLSLRKLCQAQGIGYSYSGRLYDLSRTDDRFTTGLDALLAEREADLTRDRVLRAVRANAAAGKPHGRLLYGYRRIYGDGGQFVAQVIHEEHAEVIREAAKRVASGEACYSIAEDFNRRGIPTPRGGKQGWSLSQIGRMLQNPGYIGKRVHLGKIVGDADWPAILDPETYAVCRSILTDPRRKTQRDTTVRHLLSGAAVCDVCGSRMRVQKNRTHYAYLCSARFCVSVKTTVLEQFVVAVLVARLSRPDALDLLAPPADRGVVEQARQEAKQKRARLEEWYAAAARDEITPAGLASIERTLLAEIEDAERRAEHVDVPPLVRDLVGPGVEQRWERLTIGQQREVVSLLLDLRVGKTYQGARSLDPRRLGNSRWRGDSQTWAERGLV
ncbi:recombinase family protein [Micromonospora coerulea]|uniref:recombinase family protein n=1 Tax=Micromonospora coerulea TaxID=47856 RepID=UPI001904E5E0|nr:recombinase family protein [Micromonospora veneta]